MIYKRNLLYLKKQARQTFLIYPNLGVYTVCFTCIYCDIEPKNAKQNHLWYKKSITIILIIISF
jgi:hypothetical protein